MTAGFFDVSFFSHPIFERYINETCCPPPLSLLGEHSLHQTSAQIIARIHSIPRAIELARRGICLQRLVSQAHNSAPRDIQSRKQSSPFRFFSALALLFQPPFRYRVGIHVTSHDFMTTHHIASSLAPAIYLWRPAVEEGYPKTAYRRVLLPNAFRRWPVRSRCRILIGDTFPKRARRTPLQMVMRRA